MFSWSTANTPARLPLEPESEICTRSAAKLQSQLRDDGTSRSWFCTCSVERAFDKSAAVSDSSWETLKSCTKSMINFTFSAFDLPS